MDSDYEFIDTSGNDQFEGSQELDRAIEQQLQSQLVIFLNKILKEINTIHTSHH